MSNRIVLCHYCLRPAKLVTGKVIYPHRKDLYNLQFWQCESCGAYVGCHKRSDAVPLGRLANAELRAAKSRAHAAFDPLWQWGSMSRGAAYKWLAKQMGITQQDCHIGMFTVEQCEQVVTIVNNFEDLS